MKKFLFITFLVSLLNLICFAQPIPSFISDSLDNYVNRALEQWQIPGAAVLIVKDGKIVVAKGYGVKEYGTNDKVDESTMFMIGSNTKAFTGTLLAMLEYEQKLKLEDKVVKFLPEFRMKDTWVTNNLNLIDIVTHRMGLETFQGDFMYWSSDLTEDQVIEKFGKLTPKYDFRSKYGYTNAGYAIASKIIHQVTGKEWKDFLKEKILLQLNMKNTTALYVEFAKAENIAKPHTVIEGKTIILPFENIDNMAACGSMGSSVKEMSNWIIAQLDSGKLNGEQVIPFKVIERTRQPQIIIRRSRHPFNTTHFSLYGLGWVMEDYEGREIISHTGGVNGFVTSVTLLPEEKLGIVVLTNNDQNAFFQMLKWEIVDAYLGLPYRNYNEFTFQRAVKSNEEKYKQINSWRDSVKMNLKTDLALEEFTGKYEHEVYGFAEIKKVSHNFSLEPELELTLEHHSKIKGKLQHIGNNRFLCTYSDPTYGIKVFPFEIENGKVKSFDLYVDDFIDYLPYRFYKK
jgi:CubicO group peptidase (beta-lactamase class C family)